MPRKSVSLTDKALSGIDRFRRANSLASESDAIRSLIEIGLRVHASESMWTELTYSEGLLGRINAGLAKLDDEIRARFAALDGTRPPTTWNSEKKMWVAKNGYSG